MAIAFVQEFSIQDGDTSTANYDGVVAELGLQGNDVDGLIAHTAGFITTEASSASSTCGRAGRRASGSSTSV